VYICHWNMKRTYVGVGHLVGNQIKVLFLGQVIVGHIYRPGVVLCCDYL